MPNRSGAATFILLGGDVLTLALITLIGFAMHGELDSAGTRMWTTFLPALVGWLLLAPALGLYDLTLTRQARQLYRPVLAGLFVGTMGAALRGLWLNQPIVPIFSIVLAGTAALGITLWRAVWLLTYTRQARHG